MPRAEEQTSKMSAQLIRFGYKEWFLQRTLYVTDFNLILQLGYRKWIL